MGKQEKPLVAVYDIFGTSFLWRCDDNNASGNSDEPYLEARDGLCALLRGHWNEGMPIVFFTDAPDHSILRPLINALDGIGLSDIDFYFCSSVQRGKSYAKNFKPLSDVLGCEPYRMVFTGDTMASACDLESAYAFRTPFIHVPINPHYHDAPIHAIRSLSLQALSLQRIINKGFEGVVDFTYQGGMWRPCLRSYDDVLKDYRTRTGTKEEHPPIPMLSECPPRHVPARGRA